MELERFSVDKSWFSSIFKHFSVAIANKCSNEMMKTRGEVKLG